MTASHNGPEQVPIIILCGGTGLYVDGSGQRRNKALVPVDGLPMVAHVMRLYARFGFRKFLLTAGRQSESFPAALEEVRELAFPSDLSIELLSSGEDSPTWPRLTACEARLGKVEGFGIAYCDSLADIDLAAALDAHRTSGLALSLAAVFLPTRFRLLGLRPPDPLVRGFAEQPILRSDRINGGFYFAKPELFKLGRESVGSKEATAAFEGVILEKLVAAGQVASFLVNGEFRCLDGERDISPIAQLAKRLT